MPFWKQVREAIQCQIEDFFNVRWQAVVLMLLVVVALIERAYMRTAYSIGYHPPLWGVYFLIGVVSLVALYNVRRFLK